MRFRELLGVPPDGYERGNNFMRLVLGPALLEVNGLSDMGANAEFVRRHSRPPIETVMIAWWKKVGNQFRAAVEERKRSKVGRMARLKAAAKG
jgi:hypothetical protein